MLSGTEKTVNKEEVFSDFSKQKSIYIKLNYVISGLKQEKVLFLHATNSEGVFFLQDDAGTKSS